MEDLIIRECGRSDLQALLTLYTQLHDNALPPETESLQKLWGDIINDEKIHLLIGCVGGHVVSSCTLVIIPNLTHCQRPYALIENVITDKAKRAKGYASALLSFAKELAMKNNCYKIMLLTGSKEESTLAFYERAGYNRKDKTAFIQWLE